ncbi:hypothetical protein ACWJJH_13725 [Endozoicomonadaceae bacterium StTr2]
MNYRAVALFCFLFSSLIFHYEKASAGGGSVEVSKEIVNRFFLHRGFCYSKELMEACGTLESKKITEDEDADEDGSVVNFNPAAATPAVTRPTDDSEETTLRADLIEKSHAQTKDGTQFYDKSRGQMRNYQKVMKMVKTGGRNLLGGGKERQKMATPSTHMAGQLILPTNCPVAVYPAHKIPVMDGAVSPENDVSRFYVKKLNLKRKDLLVSEHILYRCQKKEDDVVIGMYGAFRSMKTIRLDAALKGIKLIGVRRSAKPSAVYKCLFNPDDPQFSFKPRFHVDTTEYKFEVHESDLVVIRRMDCSSPDVQGGKKKHIISYLTVMLDAQEYPCIRKTDFVVYLHSWMPTRVTPHCISIGERDETVVYGALARAGDKTCPSHMRLLLTLDRSIYDGMGLAGAVPLLTLNQLTNTGADMVKCCPTQHDLDHLMTLSSALKKSYQGAESEYSRYACLIPDSDMLLAVLSSTQSTLEPYVAQELSVPAIPQAPFMARSSSQDLTGVDIPELPADTESRDQPVVAHQSSRDGENGGSGSPSLTQVNAEERRTEN